MPSSWKLFILMLTVSWLPSSSACASVPPDIIVAKQSVGRCPFLPDYHEFKLTLRKFLVKEGFDDEFIPQSTSSNKSEFMQNQLGMNFTA